MLIPTLIALFAAATHASPECTATQTPARGAIFFLESASAPEDSTLVVRLCFAATPTTRLATARLTIPYDTALLRYAGSSAGGSPDRMVIVTGSRRGSISITASASGGMFTGLVGTLTFRRLPVKPSVPVSAPQIVQATGVDRRPVAGVRGAGLTVTAPATSAVQIDSIVPRSATVANGELISITVFGNGFTATDNALFMNGVRIGAIRSLDGRSSSFVVPRSFPATSEVPPQLLGPGDFTLQIKNTAGTSNIVTLTLRTP